MPNRIEGKTGTLHMTDPASALQFVADTQNMSINRSANSEGISIHGQNSQVTLSSEITYEVSFDGLFSTDDVGQSTIEEGATVPWTWFVTDDQSGAGPSYGGELVISSVEMSFPADGRATFSVSGTGTGDLIKNGVW